MDVEFGILRSHAEKMAKKLPTKNFSKEIFQEKDFLFQKKEFFKYNKKNSSIESQQFT